MKVVCESCELSGMAWLGLAWLGLRVLCESGERERELHQSIQPALGCEDGSWLQS